MSISWAQALGWRLARQFLDPVGNGSAVDVVRRLGAVPAFNGDPELAVSARMNGSRQGVVAHALAEGSLIKTFAFGGGTYLMPPQDAGAYLALRCASRMWELPSWVEHYGLAPDEWPEFRAAVRQALAGGPLTADDLAATVTAAHPRFKPQFEKLSITLLKPLTWQGDMSFGPTVGGQATYQTLADNPWWAGIPELDDAGRMAIMHYLGTYGPATPAHLHYYLGERLSAGKSRLTRWLADVADQLVEIDVGGEPNLIPAEQADDLEAAEPSESVLLLAGHDQWIDAPGTKDQHIVPAARRAVATKGANVVLAGGVLSGTWKADGRGRLSVTWFERAGSRPDTALVTAVVRLGELLGRPFEPSLQTDAS